MKKIHGLYWLFQTSACGRCNVPPQDCYTEHTGQTQGFRPELQTGKAWCLSDTWILIGTSTLVTFPWAWRSFYAILHTIWIQRYAFSNTQPHCAAHSPTPSWLHLEFFAEKAQTWRFLIISMSMGGDQLPGSQAEGTGATVTHTAAALQEDWAILWCSGGCSHSRAKLVTERSCTLRLEPAALLSARELQCDGHVGTSVSARQRGLSRASRECRAARESWITQFWEQMVFQLQQSHLSNLHELWMHPKRHKDLLSYKCYLTSSNCRFPPSCLLWAKDLFMCLK